MSRMPSDSWLTHDASAEEPELICERCGDELSVEVDCDEYGCAEVLRCLNQECKTNN